MRLSAVIVAVAVALLGTSCAPLSQSGTVTMTPAAEPQDDAWRTEVVSASRRHEPYDYTTRQADLRATLVTPRLRQAFAKDVRRFHGRFAKDTRKELLALGDVDEGVDPDKVIARPESEEQVLVFVAFYATDQKHRDLAIKGTIWDTHLVRGAARVKPLKMQSVRHTPAVRELFPYVDRFDDLYLVRFPAVTPEGEALLSPGDEPLRLEVSSAVASCAVDWVLQSGD